jgi:hypothetical protein
MGTRMTRMGRIFTDFQKKSALIRSVRVIRVPIVSKTTRRKVQFRKIGNFPKLASKDFG